MNMFHILIILPGGLFVTVMILTGVRLRRVGCDFRGKTPIARPLFVVGKLSMGVLWARAFYKATGAVWSSGSAVSWAAGIGAIIFAAGCGLALAAFAALGLETRFGLPDGDCRLKTGGLYAWSRHPMYTGFMPCRWEPFYTAPASFQGSA